MRLRLMTEYSVRKMLVKPRLGKRRCSGIWPPSKPRIMWEPERDRCPLWPRLEVLPMPEPIPRPTRFLLLFAALGARKLERFFDIYVLALLYDPDQMRHGLHHAADRRRILTLHHLIQPGEAQTFDHPLVLLRSGN